MRTQGKHQKLWIISPEEFADLRRSCFMSRAQCAAFLHLSVATIRSWEAGRTRASWSAVRVLRLYRLGDLGALHDSWKGWRLTPAALYSPDNRAFRAPLMARWWVTIEQARFWRRQYDAGTQLTLF